MPSRNSPSLCHPLPPTPQTPAGPPPATRRIDFLADFLAALRKQKAPRLTLYSILCTVARAPAGGCWQEEIDAVLTDSVTGTCTRMGEQGLLQITMRPRKIGSRQLRRWLSLTKEGETLVACLLNPKLGKGLIP